MAQALTEGERYEPVICLAMHDRLAVSRRELTCRRKHKNTFDRVGALNCRLMPHSGINLLIHSTREMRCEFTSLNNRSIEYYKGKTGIGLGLDVSINRQADIAYSVLAKHFRAGIHQLAGKYSGWNKLHGGSMERNSSSEMGRSGEADRSSLVLQEARL